MKAKEKPSDEFMEFAETEFESVTCPRCGCCEMFWEECWDCGGEGIHDDLYEEDPLWYDIGSYEECSTCNGKGGFWICDCDENGKHTK